MKNFKVITLLNQALTERLQNIFANSEIQFYLAEEIEAVSREVQQRSYDLFIVMNTHQPETKFWLKSIGKIIKQTAMQVLFLVEPQAVEMAISSLNWGVFQYVKLPVSDKELQLLVEAALNKNTVSDSLKSHSRKSRPTRLGNLVGASPQMQQVYTRIHQAARNEINVLLLGETGTGKDVAAQTIHQLSDRSDGPYLPINLGAYPRELVASELFGHEKGAFTGALKRSIGVFERGRNGIVFLDEIETIDEKIQVTLLRLIEQKKFHRLGGKKAIKTNTRLIVSSNEDLNALVEKGVFRKDLYYRLDFFRILMPPLRERLTDIPILVREFISRANHLLNKNILGIDDASIELLQNYDWPGNVRELKNVIQRAAILCEGNEILPENLPPRFRTLSPQKTTVTFEVGTPLEQVEKEMILSALAKSNNNRTRAAELLGISRRAIYNKLHKHNIEV